MASGIIFEVNAGWRLRRHMGCCIIVAKEVKRQGRSRQPTSMLKIFINYRWSDSRAYAGRLGDRLRSTFGDDTVFLDTHQILSGQDYEETSLAEVRQCDVLLALIGKDWLGPRLNSRADLLRQEIEKAYREKKLIIPVLLEDTSQPSSQTLPNSLAFLARLKAQRLRHASWESDVQNLISRLRVHGQEGRMTSVFLPLGLRKLAGWFLFLLFSVVSLSLSGVSPSGKAYRLILQPSAFAWVNSGAWNDEDSFLLVDSELKRIFRYSARTGHFEGEFGPRLTKPEIVQKVADGHLIEDGEGVLFRVAQNLLSKRQPVKLTAPEGRDGLKSFVQWVPVGDEILAFGDTCEFPEACKRSFVRISLDSPDSFGILHSMKIDHPRRILYYFGFSYPFVAAAGERGYFLALDIEPPRICEMPPRHEKSAYSRCLEKTPENLLRPADLPNKSGENYAATLYKALTRSNSVAGLYGQGDALYIVNRRPSKQAGLTDWTFSRIDRRTGEIKYTKDLLTQAPHLTIIPGPKYWAIVEKGEVKGLGQQEVLSVLIVSSSYFEKAGGWITLSL